MAYAAEPTWDTLPQACLPGRALPYDINKAEEDQEPCHGPPCPDSNYATLAAYLLNARTPPLFLNNSNCPLPKCPVGTVRAGQNLTLNDDCNTVEPPCPVGQNFYSFTGPAYSGGFSPDRATSSGTITYEGCLPLCNANGSDFLFAIVDKPTVEFLAEAWPSEGVLSVRATVNGVDAIFACNENVMTNDCLSEDSQIMLPDGKSRAIGTVKHGDKIMGPEGEVTVASVTTTDASPLYYRINHFKFAISGDHPVLTKAGWKAANDIRKYADVVVSRLEVGDELVTKAGPVKVTSIDVDPNAAGKKSFNLSTIGNKPFYVDGVTVKPFKDIAMKY